MLKLANSTLCLAFSSVSIAGDPLEQFNVFEIFVHNFENSPTKQYSGNLTDICPFNINKISHNAIFTAEYL